MDVLGDFLEALCTIKLAEALTVGNIMVKKRYYVLLLSVDAFLAYGVNFLGWTRVLLLINYILIYFYILKINSIQVKKFDAFLYEFFSVLIVNVIKAVIDIPVYMVVDRVDVDLDNTAVTAVLWTLSCCFIRKRGLLVSAGKGLQYWSRKRYIFASIFCLLFIGQTFLFKFGKAYTVTDGFYIMCFAGAFIGMVHKMNTSEQELELHRKYTTKYTEMIQELWFRQHKFSNQLNAIYLLSEIYKTYDELVQKQKEEMVHLKRYLMPNQLLVLGRPMVIAHIYEKICQTEEQDIALEIKISCCLKSVRVPDIYLIEIFGNLLDNAMEEVQKRGMREEIILSVSQEDEGCCISVSNEHGRILYDEYSHFFDSGYSSKGAGRGQGLPYVKRIVKRYGGLIISGNVMLKKKNYFSVRIYLPWKGKSMT